MVKVGIYKITNTINNKVYIGQSVSIYRRFNRHKTEYNKINSKEFNKHLYRAIRRYGIDNFKFEIIIECDKSKLNEYEKSYIKYYQSYLSKYGYNTSSVKDSNYTFRKLNNSILSEIIKDLKSELSIKEISNKYSLSTQFINGINRGENLRLDNENYPLKINKIRIYYCKNCNSKFTPHNLKSKYCSIKCVGISQQKTKRPNYNCLKQYINELGYLGTGKLFNVSDNTIRKWEKNFKNMLG